jgi:hypothetical protein
MKTWTTEILGYWPEVTPEDRQLRRLAREYHQRTEAFDQQHPGDWNRGLWDRNARMIQHELWLQVRELGYTRQQWQEAMYLAGHEKRHH